MLCLGMLLVSCTSKTTDLDKRLHEKEKVLLERENILLAKENSRLTRGINQAKKTKKELLENKISTKQYQKNLVIKEYFFEDKVVLTGKLEELKYSIIGGTWLSTFILILEKPIKVTSKSDNYKTQENITEVQIGFDDDIVKMPKNYLNKTITLTGELYGEQTVHDRRPAVMINTSIE